MTPSTAIPMPTLTPPTNTRIEAMSYRSPATRSSQRNLGLTKKGDLKKIEHRAMLRLDDGSNWHPKTLDRIQTYLRKRSDWGFLSTATRTVISRKVKQGFTSAKDFRSQLIANNDWNPSDDLVQEEKELEVSTFEIASQLLHMIGRAPTNVPQISNAMTIVSTPQQRPKKRPVVAKTPRTNSVVGKTVQRTASGRKTDPSQMVTPKSESRMLGSPPKDSGYKESPFLGEGLGSSPPSSGSRVTRGSRSVTPSPLFGL